MSTFPFPPAQPPGDWSVRLPGTASIGEVLVYASSIPTGDFYRWSMSGTDFPILEASGFGHTAVGLTAGYPGFAHATFGGPSLRADAVGSSFKLTGPPPPDALVRWEPPVAKTSDDVAIAAMIAPTEAFAGSISPLITLDALGTIRMVRDYSIVPQNRVVAEYWNGSGWADIGIVPLAAGTAPRFHALRVVGDVFTMWIDEDVHTFTIDPGLSQPPYVPASTWSIETSQNDGRFWIQDVTFWPNGADDAAIEQVANELAGLF